MVKDVNLGSRTKEFVMGLIGGIFGFFASLVALFIGGLAASFGSVFGSSDAVSTGNLVIGLGWMAVLFSILGIVGAAIVKNSTKLGGWFMIIAAVGGVISTFVAFILPGILLLVAGIMAVTDKTGEKINKSGKIWLLVVLVVILLSFISIFNVNKVMNQSLINTTENQTPLGPLTGTHYIQILEDKFVENDDGFFESYYVKGTAKHIGTQKIDFVTITAKFYSRDGVLRYEGSDIEYDIDPGTTFAFEISYLGEGRPRNYTLEIEETIY